MEELNKIKKAFKNYIEQNKKLPVCFTLPDMADLQQKIEAFETMDEYYQSTELEKKYIDYIKVIDENGQKRIYCQGHNENITGFTDKAIEGCKKWVLSGFVQNWLERGLINGLE